MSESLLKHVVFFKFKEGTTEDKKKELIEGYKSLPSKISEMQAFEWGPDVSVENLHKGFTHVFITTFASSADRDVYIKHPAHDAYVEVLLPHLDEIQVLDFHPEIVK